MHPNAPPEVSLAQYALVLAARDEGATLPVALEAARVRPAAWDSAEEEHSAWLATSASDPEAMRAFDAAMRAARDALNRPVPPLDEDIGAWARWLRAWSTATDPLAELTRHGMRMADVLRLTARWTEPMVADRALAERFAAEMGGSGPVPEVRPERSPLLAAAEVAVARRAPEREASPAPLPSLLGPLPGDVPEVVGAPPPPAPPPEIPVPAPDLPGAAAKGARSALPSFMASPGAAEPAGWSVERYAALCAALAADPAAAEATFFEYGLSDLALRATVDRQMQARLARDPAAMEQWRAAYARHGAQRAQAAAPGPTVVAAGTPKYVTRPMAAVPELPPDPLPFDAGAKSAPLPSRGMQVQSGMTGDVDMSAIVRKVLAFGPSGAPASALTASPNAPAPPAVQPAAPLPVTAPPAVQSAAPQQAVAPIPAPPAVQSAAAPPGPQPPPIQVKPAPAHLTETAAVDIAAIARRVLAFEKPAATGAPPSAAPGPVSPPTKRLVRFDPNTGAPLAEPYWEDIPAAPKKA